MGQFFKIFFATLLAGMVLLILPVLFLIGLASTINTEPQIIVKPNSALVINTSVPIMDKAVEDPYEMLSSFSALSGDISKPHSLKDLIDAIEAAKTDSKISGIVLEGEGFGGGLAQMQALSKAIADFKTSGKFVVSYANLYTQTDYILKSNSTKLMLNPNGAVDLKGMAMSYMFFKGLEDKYGIDVQVFRTGKFKSAVEPFIETKMSESSRLQSQELIGSIWDTLSAAVATSRGISLDQVAKAASDRVGFSAKGALDTKLVDVLAYESEYKSYVKDSLGAKNRIKVSDYTKSLSRSSVSKENRIAIVYAQGEIVYGKGQAGDISEGTMRKAFDKIAKNDKIKAIVLRVNSPGGSALTSDNIWKMIQDIKSEKPVIVSMGNYAASGGYYISCNADYIFAEPSTITGSIGVFAMIPNAKKLGQSHGITTDQVSTYPNSVDPGLFTPVESGMAQIIQASVESTYLQFKTRVAQGRGMTIEQVDSIGQGRVWSGVSALKLGLVDEIGGLDKAIAKASEIAELKEFSVEEYPKMPSSFEQFMNMFNSIDTEEAAVKATLPSDFYQLYKASKQTKGTVQSSIYARVPYGMQVSM